MGIDTTAVTLFLGELHPDVTVNGELPPHPDCKEGGVIINDIATSTRGIINTGFPTFDVTSLRYTKLNIRCKQTAKCAAGCKCAEDQCMFFFSGHEFYDRIIGNVRKALDDHSLNVKTYVLCLDQAHYVPPEKYPEQQRRAASSAKYSVPQDPYPSEYSISDRGICDPRMGHYERFDARRLMDNKELRRKLWDFISEKLLTEAFPEDTTVIFDHYLDGALVINNDTRARMKEHRHDVGEGEMIALYWASVFRDRPCAIVSTDTDVLPLGMAHLAHFPDRSYPLYWMRDKSKYAINLCEVRRRLPEKTKWNTLTFLVYVVLCGSDYFEKSSVLHYVPNKIIAEGVQFAYLNGPELFAKAIYNHVAFRYILLVIYNCLLRDRIIDEVTKKKIDQAIAKKNVSKRKKGKKGEEENEEEEKKEAAPVPYVLRTLQEVRNFMTRRKIGRHVIPSENELKDIHERFCFNMRYWCRDMKMVPEGLSRSRASPCPRGNWRHLAPVSCTYEDALQLLQQQ